MESSPRNQDYSATYNQEQEQDQDQDGSCNVNVSESAINLPDGFILNPQVGGPIGLELPRSPSMIERLELLLTEKQREQKLKATKIPALFLNIGSWKWVSKNEGDLVAKFYYGRKKLVWEFLYGALKKKIEIPWSHISAINVFVGEDKNRVLQIQLNEQPICRQEIKFQPRKHTIWGPSYDFTQGQASVCRRHTIVFPPGGLDEAFKKLLQSDNRLFNVSRQPFPTHNSPFFGNQILDFSNNRSFVVHGSSSVPAVSNDVIHGSSSVPADSNDGHHGTFQPPVQNLVQPISSSFVHHPNSNLPMPGLIFPNSNEASMGVPFEQQRTDGIREQSGNGGISLPPNGDQQHRILLNHGEESWIPDDQELELHLTNFQDLVEFSNNLSWISVLQQELHLNDHQFANEQNCFEVEPTCKPFKENHQTNFNTSCGNVDGTQVKSEVSFKEQDSWKPMETRIDDESSNVVNQMSYLDDNLCSIDHESGFNDSFAFMQPISSLPTFQFSDQDFNNDGNGMKNLDSFDPSGGCNGEFAFQNPNHGAN